MKTEKPQPTNNAADGEPVWDLSVLPEHPEPDQPEEAEYLQISFRGETIEPKQYERLLLQAYNHPEIDWQKVKEKRAIAKKILTAEEFELYRTSDKVMKIWYKIVPYLYDQFAFFNAYTNLVRNALETANEQNTDIETIIGKQAKDDFKNIIKRMLALISMEETLFITNEVPTFLKPPKVTHDLTFTLASVIAYGKLAKLDLKPANINLKDIVRIIGFDDYAYKEMQKTVIYYSSKIKY